MSVHQQVNIISPAKDGIMDINNTFKITTINVAGLNSNIKQEQVLNFMKINKINIICVTETKLRNSSVEHLYRNEKDYKSWWSCDDTNSFSTGVGIIMDNNYAKYVQKREIFKGRLLHLTMYMKGNIRLSIILVYNYANNTMKTEILELYDELNRIVKEAQKAHSRIIVLGDFNTSYDDYIQKHKNQSSIPWKMNIFVKLKSSKFKDTNLLFHQTPLST